MRFLNLLTFSCLLACLICTYLLPFVPVIPVLFRSFIENVFRSRFPRYIRSVGCTSVSSGGVFTTEIPALLKHWPGHILKVFSCSVDVHIRDCSADVAIVVPVGSIYGELWRSYLPMRKATDSLRNENPCLFLRHSLSLFGTVSHAICHECPHTCYKQKTMEICSPSTA